MIAGCVAVAIVVIIVLLLIIIILWRRQGQSVQHGGSSNNSVWFTRRSRQGGGTVNNTSTQHQNPSQPDVISDTSRDGIVHHYEKLKRNPYDKIWKASSKPQDGIRGPQSRSSRSSHKSNNSRQHGYDNDAADIHYEDINDVPEYLELN